MMTNTDHGGPVMTPELDYHNVIVSTGKEFE